MSSREGDALFERARALRDLFDRGFAEPASASAGESTDFLAVRVNGDPYALRLSELLGLVADKRIVKTPSRSDALLGLAGFRGAITPVFDLARLLGYPPADAPRWLALTRDGALIGLAFELFEAHFRITSEALVKDAADERPGLRGAVREQTLTRPIVHFPTLLTLIERHAPSSGASQER
jgi:chemotaxis signal transduction protein